MKGLELSVYDPRKGFIGPHQVDVANYIFKDRKYFRNIGHRHTQAFANQLMKKNIKNHFEEAKNLTRFMRKKDLSFSKKTKSGYKKFTVPCTTSIVSIPKSTFTQIEEASKVLMFSLRKVIQSIYGSESVEQSEFVQSLPEDMKDIFIDAIKKSPQYFKQLHHPNMKDYPFLDNVGLDLVLAEQFLNNTKDYIELVRQGRFDELPELPFRILELNAGSPSGASNNMSILEGISKVNPHLLTPFKRVMPNNHFKVLGETYKSLGEDWTGNPNGIQIVLPPGGMNGAAPEIHQLAAYSGLVYADSVQLYCDYRGFIRLRTITGSDPVVNAIYSRINADSALFNPKKGIYLRDPESGKKLYMYDPFLADQKGEALPALDMHGKPIPLESNYQIPNLLDSILSKKVYMGGLNRILDNKIILTILTEYAPIFYKKELQAAGLTERVTQIKPPKTLPPEMDSVKTIEKNPDNWVVKAPSLAGGEGVYILKTLNPKMKKDVLAMAQKKPKEFAYQELVRIGRIPVAKQNYKKKFHMANLAADIRMWVFYGGKDTLPRLTYNALVRYAPHEKGALSSIVNTSKGGGYAPFVVVDDMQSKDAVSPKELVKAQPLKKLQTELPSFVAAELLQISRIIFALKDHLKESEPSVFALTNLTASLKDQCREVISYLNPVVMEYIFDIETMLQKRIPNKAVVNYLHQLRLAKLDVVAYLNALTDSRKIKRMTEFFDELHIFEHNKADSLYKVEMGKADIKIINKMIKSLKGEKEAVRIVKNLKKAIQYDLKETPLSKRSVNKMKNIIDLFLDTVYKRLEESNTDSEILSLFQKDYRPSELSFSTLYIGKNKGSLPPMIASQRELVTGELLTESDYVSPVLREAKKAWSKVVARTKGMTPKQKDEYLAKRREVHFKKFPILRDYQRRIERKHGDHGRISKILDIAPYAKFNIENFAKQQGILLSQVFKGKLISDRIAIVSEEYLRRRSVSVMEKAGECFAKKRDRHGLLSDSDIFLWINDSLDPFSQAYTAGHELIHYQQIRDLIKTEVRSIENSPLDFSHFLNFYGNFLGLATKSSENSMRQDNLDRQPYYGFEWLYKDFFKHSFVYNFIDDLAQGVDQWNNRLNEYGSFLAYAVDQFPQSQAKALREVIPALENGKNIRFAKDIGLDIPYDEVKSVLPTANEKQLKMYRRLIVNAIYSSNPSQEALRVIASHQLYGVRFSRLNEQDMLTIHPPLMPISLGATYNQTQQQQ